VIVRAEHDLGTIVRACGASFLRSHSTTVAQRKALRAIAACRTPALGGQRQQCDRCGYEHIQWHSCRSRSCPRCQGAARAAWVEARQSELLPVPYFHVVFTVPEELNILARRAPRVFYQLLFRAAGATLIDIASSRLHIQAGLLAVLHTWSQTLILHPHVHCVVPGGGFAIHRPGWISVRKPSFFLPVRVLSRRFRTLLCNALTEAHLPFDPQEIGRIVASVRTKEWVVYAKPPFGGPAQVLAYLANYTHRIAISNARIVAFGGDKVTFRYRDRPGSHRLMTLSADEFLRRFLLHVVPSRFVRIRYYGFMANRSRAGSLDRARQLIGERPLPVVQITASPELPRCPACAEGTLLVIASVPARNSTAILQDSS
jgi:hypothetical protein